MVEDEKKGILKEARDEAKMIIREANKKVEATIRQIRESEAEKMLTRKLRADLEAHDRQLSAVLPTEKKKKITGTTLHPGDRVKLDEQTGTGVVMSVKGRQAEVQFGLLKSFVELDRLTKVGALQKEEKSISRSWGGINKVQKMAQFSHELSIKGMRVEEALPKIDHFVDEAILLGADEIKVAHGKGHGILRDALRTHLKGHPYITAILDEHADRGGSGVSVITLK